MWTWSRCAVVSCGPLIKNWLFQSGKVFYGQTSPNLTLLEITDAESSGLKRFMGVHKCIRYGQLACFGRHYECWKLYKGRRHIFQGRPCVFQQDNVKPHTAAITTAWLHSRRVWVLYWPACSLDLSPIENIWHVIKRKICQRWPITLQQLET